MGLFVLSEPEFYEFIELTELQKCFNSVNSGSDKLKTVSTAILTDQSDRR